MRVLIRRSDEERVAYYGVEYFWTLNSDGDIGMNFEDKSANSEEVKGQLLETHDGCIASPDHNYMGEPDTVVDKRRDK